MAAEQALVDSIRAAKGGNATEANYTDRNGVVMVVGCGACCSRATRLAPSFWVHRVGGLIPKRQIQVVDCHPSAGDDIARRLDRLCLQSPKDLTVVGGVASC